MVWVGDLAVAWVTGMEATEVWEAVMIDSGKATEAWEADMTDSDEAMEAWEAVMIGSDALWEVDMIDLDVPWDEASALVLIWGQLGCSEC